MTILGKCELDEFDDFIVDQSMRHPKRKEVLEILDNIINLVYELAYLGFIGHKNASIDVPLMTLKCLWRGEWFVRPCIMVL